MHNDLSPANNATPIWQWLKQNIARIKNKWRQKTMKYNFTTCVIATGPKAQSILQISSNTLIVTDSEKYQEF